jgi:hypothetical protein
MQIDTVLPTEEISDEDSSDDEGKIHDSNSLVGKVS